MRAAEHAPLGGRRNTWASHRRSGGGGGGSRTHATWSRSPSAAASCNGVLLPCLEPCRHRRRPRLPLRSTRASGVRGRVRSTTQGGARRTACRRPPRSPPRVAQPRVVARCGAVRHRRAHPWPRGGGLRRGRLARPPKRGSGSDGLIASESRLAPARLRCLRWLPYKGLAGPGSPHAHPAEWSRQLARGAALRGTRE
jgi:hypothetical protein